jgi:hypothetical protein
MNSNEQLTDRELLLKILSLLEKPKQERKPAEKVAPPTLQAIQQYVKESEYIINPITFHNHYAATNWRDVSGTPVKNWKLKATTWNVRELERRGAVAGRNGQSVISNELSALSNASQ